MASVTTGSRTDDTTYVQVVHRLNGRRPQTTMLAEWPKHIYRAVEQFGWKWAGWWRTW